MMAYFLSSIFSYRSYTVSEQNPFLFNPIIIDQKGLVISFIHLFLYNYIFLHVFMLFLIIIHKDHLNAMQNM